MRNLGLLPRGAALRGKPGVWGRSVAGVATLAILATTLVAGLSGDASAGESTGTVGGDSSARTVTLASGQSFSVGNASSTTTEFAVSPTIATTAAASSGLQANRASSYTPAGPSTSQWLTALPFANATTPVTVPPALRNVFEPTPVYQFDISWGEPVANPVVNLLGSMSVSSASSYPTASAGQTLSFAGAKDSGGGDVAVQSIQAISGITDVGYTINGARIDANSVSCLYGNVPPSYCQSAETTAANVTAAMPQSSGTTSALSGTVRIDTGGIAVKKITVSVGARFYTSPSSTTAYLPEISVQPVISTEVSALSRTTTSYGAANHAMPMGQDSAANLHLGASIASAYKGAYTTTVVPGTASDNSDAGYDGLTKFYFEDDPSKAVVTQISGSDVGRVISTDVEVSGAQNRDASVAGWIDFTGAGNFSATAARSNTAHVSGGNGTATLSWTVLSATYNGDLPIRLRVGYGDDAVSSPTGGAAAGEVEDYTGKLAGVSFAYDAKAWTCDTYAYMFQNENGNDATQKLSRIDLASGATTEFPNTLPYAINGIGYNTQDNYFYGVLQANNTLVVAKVANQASGFQMTTMTPTGIPSGYGSGASWYSGDFDSLGHLWLMSSDGNRYIQIDYAKNSPTYNSVLSYGTLPGINDNWSNDWSWVSSKGAFYGSYGNLTSATGLLLVKMVPDAAGHLTRTQLGRVKASGSATSTSPYGGSFTDGTYFYLQDNLNGEIFRVDVDSLSGLLISKGRVSQTNDGARCGTASIGSLTAKTEVVARSNPADQFTVAVLAADGTIGDSATTSGAGTSASTVNFPMSTGATGIITQTMAAGSVGKLTDYTSTVKCVNSDTGGSVNATAVGVGRWTVPISSGDDYVCTISNVAAPLPAMTLVKTVSPSDNGSFTLGRELTYSFAVRNTGNMPLTGLAIEELTFNGSNPMSAITCPVTELPAFTGATTCTAKYTLTQADIDSGAVANTAKATASSALDVVESNVSFASVGPAKDQGLVLTKTADPAVATTIGQEITYTYSVVNVGQTTMLGLAIAETAFTGTGGTPAVTCPETTLVPGQRVECTAKYSVTRNDLLAPSSILSNTASASAKNGVGTLYTSNESTATVSLPAPGLTVSKTTDLAPGASAVPGSTVNYTISLTNPGLKGITGVTFSDDLSDVLDDAVYGADAAATAGSVSYSAPKLSWSGDVAAGQTVKVTYSVIVNKPSTGDLVLANKVVVVGGDSNCEADSTDPACGGSTEVAGVVWKKVSNVPSGEKAKPGQTITYTVTGYNNSATAASGASFTDDLSSTLAVAKYNNDAAIASSGPGTVSYSEPNLAWSGDLAAGQSVTITYTVTINVTATGTVRLTNILVSDDGGSCPPGSVDPDCYAVVPSGGVTFAKSTNVAPGEKAMPGSDVTYTITAFNPTSDRVTGLSFDDDLVGVLDDASFNFAKDTQHSSGLLKYTGTVLNWTGDLDAGESATITYTVHVNKPSTGDLVLTNSVVSASSSNCPAGSIDPRCSTTTEVSGVVWSKQASKDSAKPGDTVTYTVTGLNNSKTAATGVSFTDDLADVLRVATYNADAAVKSGDPGTVSYSEPVLSWAGDLDAGQSVTVTYTVTIKADVPVGEHLLTNTLVSAGGDGGGTCPAGSTDPDCTSEVPFGGVKWTKSTTLPAGTPAMPGQAVTYVITGKNDSDAKVTGASFVDDLSKVLDDATFDAAKDASTTGGILTFDSPELKWAGDLEAGASVTVTYTVYVNKPSTGDLKLTNKVVAGGDNSNCDVGSTDPACGGTVDVSGVVWSKKASTDNAKPGDVVTYTVTGLNNSATTASGASFTDDLTEALKVANYNDDAAVKSGDPGAVSLATPVLSWTGDLAAGQSVTVTYSVTIKSNVAKGSHSISNAIVSGGGDGGGTCPAGSTDPDCTTEVPFGGVTWTKTSDVPAGSVAVPGSDVTYTITGVNDSDEKVVGTSFVDDLSKVIDDASFDFGKDASATGGRLSFDSPELKWTGDLDAGASVTVTYTVHVNKPSTGDLKLTNKVVAGDDSNCASGSTDPACGGTVEVSGMVWSKVSDVPAGESAKPGQKITYTVTGLNNSAATATGASFTDDLTSALAVATYGNDATIGAGGPGTVTYTDPVLTWTGDVAAGQTVTVTYSVTINFDASGAVSLTNTIVSGDGGTCPPGSTDPDCTSVVDSGSVTFTKTTDLPAGQAARPGQVVRYTITAKNTTDAKADGVSFTDDLTRVLDDAVYGGDVSASSGTVSYSQPVISWTGDLDVNETATITYSVTVNKPSTGDLVLSNALVSQDSSNCPEGSTDPRCSTTTEVSGVVWSKTSDVPTGQNAKPGQKVTYTVRGLNNSDTTATAASFADDLTEALKVANYNSDAAIAASGPGAVSYTEPVVSWTGDLAAGQTVTVTYSVTIKSNVAKGSHSITNTVVSGGGDDGGTCPEGSTDPDCTIVIPFGEVTWVKTSSVPSGKKAVPGSSVTYTVTGTNDSDTAVSGTSFTDDLSKVLDDATFDATTARASSGTVSYSEPTLSWSGDLEPGASVTVTYTVVVKKPSTGDLVLFNTVLAGADSNCPEGSTDPRCGGEVPVGGVIWSKTSDVPEGEKAHPGDVVTYTVTGVNNSKTAAVGATMSDDLSDALLVADYNGDATEANGIGAVDFTSPVLSWTGDVPAGQSVTITYSVTIKATATGTVRIVNTVVSDDGGTCPPGSTAVECTAVIPSGGITFTKSTNLNPGEKAQPGQDVVYTITAFNPGTDDVSGVSFTDDLTKVLDDATFDFAKDASATSGDLSFATPELKWTGDLDAGATATITYTVHVEKPSTGDLVLSNVVVSGSGSNCYAGSTDPRCGGDTHVSGVVWNKTASTRSAKPGDTVTYTVTGLNNSAEVATGVSFSDDLTNALAVATYGNDAAIAAGDPGTVSYTKPVLSWIGDLGAGQGVTVTYSVTIKENVPVGDHTLTNAIVSGGGEDGGTCPEGSTDPDCTTEVPFGGVIWTKVSDVPAGSAAMPGTDITYTITGVNDSDAKVTATSFADDLAKVLDDATFDFAKDARMSSGLLKFEGGVLTWTGDLDAGQSVTVTYVVHVNKPSTGDLKLTNKVVAGDDSNCAAGSSDPACGGTTEVSGVVWSKVSDVAAGQKAKPGQTVTYTITGLNNSASTATGASFSDDLTGVLAVATYGSDAAISASGPGAVSYTEPVLTWTGDLAAGQSVTVTYTVTIDQDVPVGEHSMTNTVVSSGGDGGTCPEGSTDPECTTEVPFGGVTWTKTSDVPAGSVAVPGSDVTYTITGVNDSDDKVTGASFVDDLSKVLDDASFDAAKDASTTSGTLTFDTPELKWTGDLEAGASVTVTYTVHVNKPSTGDLKLTNKVVAGEDSNCSAGSTDPACGGTVEVSGVVWSKVSDVPAGQNAKPGQKVTYTVTGLNNSAATATGASFTDDLTNALAVGTYGNDAAISASGPGTVSYTEPVLSWTGDMAAGQSVTVTYSVTIHSNVPVGQHSLKNTIVSGDGDEGTCPPGSTDPDCTVVIPFGEVTWTKTTTLPAGSVAMPGQEVTYVITGVNDSDTRVADASFVDDLSNVLDDASFDFGKNASATQGDLTFDSPELKWAGDLEPGASVTVRYTVQVNKPSQGDLKLTNKIVAGENSNCAEGSTDPGCGGTTEVSGVVWSKKASTNNAKPGDTINYTITGLNNSATTATGASFTDDLSSVLAVAAYNENAAVKVGDPGTVSYAEPVLSWVGDLAAGQSVTITYSVTINFEASGVVSLVNTIVSGDGGTCPAGSTDPDCTSVVDSGSVTFTKATDLPAGQAARPGQVVRYTITAKNTTDAKADGVSFTDDLSQVLDDARYGDNVSASSGTVSYSQPVISWTGDLDVNETATITYSVTVNKPSTGDLVLSNALVSQDSSNCPEGSTDPRCSTSTEVSGVVWSKTSDVPTGQNAKPGQKITYTIHGLNNSGSTAVGASFTDDLTQALGVASYGNDAAVASGGPGTVSYSEPVISWTGDLTSGQEVTVTYSMTIRAGITGDHRLVNAIVSGDSDTCFPGSLDPDCTSIIDYGQVTFTKTSDVPAGTKVKPGQRVTYTVTALNDTAADVVGAEFTDDLSGVLDDATFDPSEVTSRVGTVSYSRPILSWTGDVAAGQTTTITYVVTVNSPDAGDHVLSNAVYSDTEDTNCPPGSTDPSCGTTSEVSGLTVTKSSSIPAGKAAAPGEIVTYSVSVLNDGNEMRDDANFTDDLTGVLDDATLVDGSITVTPDVGTAALDGTGTKLTWSGSLAPLQKVTITYQVKVADPVGGDRVLNNVVVSTSDNNSCPTGAEPGCSTSDKAGALTVVKSSDVPSGEAALPGQVVTYSIVGRNDTADAMHGAEIVDDLSSVLDDAAFVDGSLLATIPTAHLDKGVITWSGDLASGQSVTITYSVSVAALGLGNGDHVLMNSVVSTNPNPDGSGGDGNTNCAEGSPDPRCQTVSPVAGLTISKQASVANGGVVAPGDRVDYTITAKNTGGAPINTGAFSDDLTEVLKSSDLDMSSIAIATSSGGHYDAATRILSWSGILAPGQEISLVYTVTVKTAGIVDGTTLVNRVATSNPSSNCQVGSEDPNCVTENPISGFKIAKVSDAAPVVTAGERVGYTVTGKNTGGADATGLTITDDLADVLDDASWNGDVVASTGVVSFDPTSHKMTWTGDLAQGETVTITYSITVLDPSTTGGNHRLVNYASSTDGGSTCEPGSTDPECGGGTDIFGFTTVKTTDVVPGQVVQPGQVLTYTITGTNTGSIGLAGATFSDDLSGVLDDADLVPGSLTSSVGTATLEGTTITWTGDLVAGASATVTYQVTVRAASTGDNSLVNGLESTTDGGNCPPGSTDPRCVTVNPVAGFTVALRADVLANKPMIPGQSIQYSVIATNTGATTLKGASYINDLSAVLDDGAMIGDLVVSGPAGPIGVAVFDPVAKTITWTGDLEPGESATVTYTVRMNAPGTGDHDALNQVSSTTEGSNCAPGSKDPNCMRDNPIKELVVTKTVDHADEVDPGEVLTYTVKLCNVGKVDFTSTSFVDDMSKVLDDAVFNGDAQASAGSVTMRGSTLTWSGAVPVGATVTITYSVTVKPANSGDGKIVNSIVSSDGGASNCPPGSVDPQCVTDTDVTVPGLVDPSLVPNAGTGSDIASLASTGAKIGGAAALSSLLLSLGLGMLIASRGRKRDQRMAK